MPSDSTDTPEQAAARARLTPRRRALLILISLVFSLIVLGSLEGAFRLAGFGGYPTTFRRVGTLADGASLIISDNPGPASYFFANRSRPGTLNQAALVMPKPPGVFRVVLAGESAMKGFPQPRALSAAAFLEAMLGDIWPDRRIEVVNIGTTAVASYPVLGMLTESLNYDPDLCVVYVGNNEFFGAFGVASLHSAGRSPSAIRFLRAVRSLAIAQAIDRVVNRASADATADKTLMEAMMGRAKIARDDPIRAAAARNLETFTGDMIRRCKQRNVPVIVCTLPSNERDLAPIGDTTPPNLSQAQRDRYTATLGSGDPAALTALVQQYPTNALAHFRLAEARLAAGDLQDAQSGFQTAIDLDPMPWRPPSQSVEALRRAAAAGGAPLCDLQAAFRVAGRQPIGWDLMDDHVHPTLAGQDLIARTIVQTMTTMQGAVAVKPEDFAALHTFDHYAEQLGDNPYDRYGVAHTMRVLARIPFFKETNPEFLQRTDALCGGLISPMPPAVRDALAEWQKPSTHQGEMRPITAMVGRVLIQARDFERAEQCYETAARSCSLYSSWNIEYTYFTLICRERTRGSLGEPDLAEALQAIRRGEMLLGQGRSTTGQSERFVGRLHQLRREFDLAIPFLLTAREKLSGTDLVANDQALVESYVKTGQSERARDLLQNGIDKSGQYADLYKRMLAALDDPKSSPLPGK